MANEHAANFDLTGSVVFITGPARGLGRASALACAAAGADLVLGYRYQNSLTLELVVSHFEPGSAFDGDTPANLLLFTSRLSF